jgi:CTP synthase (UTP-ammonia lyase)
VARAQPDLTGGLVRPVDRRDRRPGMPAGVRVALIGDHDPTVTAHRAIPLALSRATDATGVDVQPTWVHTSTIPDPADEFLSGYDGVWCVPASPYSSTAGALRAIRYARETGIPFLGTCGGFQHAALEYARHVLGWSAADHAEIDPSAALAIVTPLSCALVERDGIIRLLAESRAATLCGTVELHEEYHCSYGLNPAYEAELERSGLRVTGRDPAGEARVVELDRHPFYLATLFQPERAGLRGQCHPIVAGFVQAANERQRTQESTWRTSAIPSATSPTRGH